MAICRRSTQQYDLLGLPVTATPRDVQRAYYTLSAKIHPDKNPNNPKASGNRRTAHTAAATLVHACWRRRRLRRETPLRDCTVMPRFSLLRLRAGPPQAKVAMQILNDARQELRSRLEVEEMEAHRAQAEEDVAGSMRQPVF